MTESYRLPRESYSEQDWLERERNTLFADAWYFIATTNDLKEPGDYRTLRIGCAPLALIRDGEGVLRAFHNLCRHRGTELLDGESGNAGKTLVCPYHRWTYGLDGALRGLPDRTACFPDLDRSSLGLKSAAIGTFKELIFVNPNSAADFEAWIAPLKGREWPHDLFASDVKEAAPLLYDLKCNWKVYAENAIDGYHLAYLHENTLGGPAPDKNIWEQAGDHMIWYANEDGVRHRLPVKIREETGTMGMIKSARESGYGGVYFLFPATLITPTPFGLSISSLQPVAPGLTRMTVRHWIGPWQWRDERRYIQGYDKKTGIISSDNWTRHPLETGDFQTEDVWICEKVQRGLESPAFEPGPLSIGAGAEDPIRWFHASLRRALTAARTQQAKSST